ncbi:PucR family transcriptional regulator [Bacillus sp. B15-48]|uniref:PucR family transcriptional regulator n=1 Tax=Bacillus sp. B15-48 TaxID=1548601 RepID=UPI00193FFC95|nr:PucR family transcriptional regulator [Bacillus sp. B15-48]MBM4761215.1 hypothetical protein [Bacillus sp. B15-48]
MYFSLWNFADWFSKEKIVCIPSISKDTADIHFLSTVNSRNCNQLLQGSATICDGTLAGYPDYRTVMFKGEDMILFPSATPSQIINSGNQMIETFFRWEDNLHDIILNKGTISSLLTAGESMLHFPLAIISSDSGVLYSSTNWPLSLSHFDFGSPSEKEGLYSLNPMFRTIYAEGTRTILTQSLISEKNYLGELIAFKGVPKFSPGDFILFQALSTAILNYFDINERLNELGQSLDSFFIDALFRSYIDTKKFHSLSANAGWPENLLFSLYCIRPIKEDSFKQLDSLTSVLKNIVPTSSCFIYKNDIIFISYSNADTISSVTKQIRASVPTDCFVIGQSLLFDECYNLPNGYKQSIHAANYAQKLKLQFISTEDILPQIIFESSGDNEWLHSLIHSDLLKLMEIDRTGHQELLKTLYYFLILGQSGSAAADALCIHRNTLRYRINKIKSILSVDINQPIVIDQLLASYLIAGKNFIFNK